MTRYDESIEKLTQLIAASPKRPLLVGFDGQGGAGKSTLTRELAARLPGSVIVEGDDFYRDTPDEERLTFGPEEGYQRYFDWERLLEEVVLPASRGDEILRYHRYDWINQTLGARVEQPMPAIVLLEGVYTLRPQLRDHFDVKVYVGAGEAVRLRRQVERNQNSGDWIKRWLAAEDFYVLHIDPESHADIVISGGV